MKQPRPNPVPPRRADSESRVVGVRSAVVTSAETSSRMRRQRRRDTGPELELRKAIRSHGFGYRIHIRPRSDVSREADIVFVGSMVAVFVDGCFWHGCPEHATWPRSNAGFWRDKIERNRERDLETDRLLGDAGWKVVRVWEHETTLLAVERVLAAVVSRRGQHAPRSDQSGVRRPSRQQPPLCRP